MDWKSTSVVPKGTHHLFRGRPLYERRFDAVLKYHAPGLAPVQVGSEAWHIDMRGEEAYPQRFDRTFGFYEGRAAVIDGDGWHHILPDGQELYSERYDWCGNYQGGRCAVRGKDGRYLHLKTSGASAYDHRWAYTGDYRDGIAVAQGDNGLSIHIDIQGLPLHGQSFLDLDVFHKGYARARDDGGWTHIDTTGKPLYKKRFSMVEPFYNGQARVETNSGALWIIDEAGERLRELRPPLRSAFHRLSSMLVGYWQTQGIGAAVALGLFEALPGPLDYLSKAMALPPESASRLLRAMASLDLVSCDGGVWSTTEGGDLLRTDNPNTLADAAQEYAGPLSEAWWRLTDALQDPQSTGIFGKVAGDGERIEGHHRMLGSYAQVDYGPWISALEIGHGERVLDAGGGRGALARMIQDAYPNAKVTVGDLPAVARGIQGVESVGMDLFEPWPGEADVVVLARVLHDWPDSEALAILKQARTALAPGGRLVCLEMAGDEGGYAGALCDLHLLAATGGKERSKPEWEALFKGAGLRLEGIETRSDSIVSMLKVVPSV